jgi:malonate decarboxylase beta subunit
MVQLLAKGLVDCLARERAFLLLDENSAKEIINPFDGLESPHLEKQGIVPQADDGMIIVKGTLAGKETVVISIEGSFQGGGIGEVSGAKFAGTLERILEDCKSGKKVYPVIIYDTGGVRLQEANYGLLSIAEISAAIVELRRYVPVVGLIPGKIGSFGGMSLSAGLCSALIMTEEGRLGMNGPEVVEQEAGIRELNARDKVLTWKMIGGKTRKAMGLVDEIVEDNIEAYQAAILAVWAKPDAIVQRTEQYEKFLTIYKAVTLTEKKLTIEEAVEQFSKLEKNELVIQSDNKSNRGAIWFDLLTGGKQSISDVPSVLVADSQLNGRNVRFIAVTVNEKNSFYRARNGEVGLIEGWTIAKYVRQAIEEDRFEKEKRIIVPIVDVPGQAFGYHEELLGIYLACSSAVDAYANARIDGHPLVSLLVGNAISGAFLCHGMQSNRLIALNDSKVNVHVMSKKSAARITQRTLEELEAASKETPSMAYDIKSFEKLGALHLLMDNIEADCPTTDDVEKVNVAINEAVSHIAKSNSHNLSIRLQSEIAKSSGRIASIKVRELIDAQWF